MGRHATRAEELDRLLGKRWLTVHECLALFEPDTSWMRDPVTRQSFTSWMGDAVF